MFAILAAYCATRFFAATDLPEMLRWAAGFFTSLILVVSGKIWYWMQMDRFAVTREIKRVELLIAHLSAEWRRGSDAA